MDEEKVRDIKRGPGRPPESRREFDLIELEELCAIQCTQPEIASVFGVSVATIEKRIVKDKEFRAAMERGYGRGTISVRRKQFQLLMEGDNTTMAIWLGKQFLNQRDKSDNRLAGEDGKPIALSIEVLDDLAARVRAAKDIDGSS